MTLENTYVRTAGVSTMVDTDALAMRKLGTYLPDIAPLLAVLMAENRPAWHADALCREYPPEWWYPERGEPTSRAKDVCSRCLVRPECLAAALNDGQNHGIWGGTSGRERRKLRTVPSGTVAA